MVTSFSGATGAVNGKLQHQEVSLYLDIFTTNHNDISKIRTKIDKYWKALSSTKNIDGSKEPRLSMAILSLDEAQVCDTLKISRNNPTISGRDYYHQLHSHVIKFINNDNDYE